jgi:uncharacterized lipoprotein NlpE involved in copper resistance/heat shock protein HslJ
MRILVRTAIVIAFAALGACGTSGSAGPASAGTADDEIVDAAHNSRNSLDWDGIYTGTLPCADCDGIRSTVTLNTDGTFSRERVYVGKSDTPIADSGTFAWNEAGSIVTLSGDDGEQQYQVGENRLFHLDRDGIRISGDLADRYVLRKVTRDPRIEDQAWILVELMGEPVTVPEGGKRAFLRLSSAETRLGGNASCNTFFGRYALGPGDRLRIGGNLGSTMMACPDMSTEDRFLSAILGVDSYEVDDDRLALLDAGRTPLMRFELSPD